MFVKSFWQPFHLKFAQKKIISAVPKLNLRHCYLEGIVSASNPSQILCFTFLGWVSSNQSWSSPMIILIRLLGCLFVVRDNSHEVIGGTRCSIAQFSSALPFPLHWKAPEISRILQNNCKQRVLYLNVGKSALNVIQVGEVISITLLLSVIGGKKEVELLWFKNWKICFFKRFSVTYS